MSTVLEQLSKKSASELSAKELNSIRCYRTYTQQLKRLSSKETRLRKQAESAQKAHELIKTKREALTEKIAALETKLEASVEVKKEKTATKKKGTNGTAKSTDKESQPDAGRS